MSEPTARSTYPLTSLIPSPVLPATPGMGDYGRERAVFEALDFRRNELCESLGYKDNGVALLGKLFELVRSALRIVLGKYGKPERRKAVNTVTVAHCGYFIHTVHASFHGLFLHSCR